MMGQDVEFRFVDTHCHLDLFPKPEELVKEIDSDGILTVAVTNAPFLFANTVKLSQKSSRVVPALGLHPELVSSHGSQLPDFHELLPSTRFVGEVGLDYVTKDQANRREQRGVFESIVAACSDAGDKILTIHTRRSAQDTLDILGDNFRGTAILHWYSGALRDLRRALAVGCYFSVTPPMTQSENGQRLIREIPLERLFTESDGPFAKHGGSPSSPRAIPAVIDALASLYGRTKLEIEEAVLTNLGVIMRQ